MRAGGCAAGGFAFGDGDERTAAPVVGEEPPGALVFGVELSAGFGADVLVAGGGVFFVTALDELGKEIAAGVGCGCCCERLLALDAVEAVAVLGCFLAGMFSAVIPAGCSLATRTGVCVTGREDAGFAAVADEGEAAASVWAEAVS